ncbi:17-beta-hydroxysteroid dehydrogenase 13-like [Condylostylus longicornis]|uniref:17-beta-hydroxysteroid dehydrogenase 13-like n=1 Tax=Condylostylus longicornis TaxID=2530218 RepID=UPI00244DA254|nr:17-beta-hydroxysteroid dehydrogenase 13-like [Condylostylus longicornis]XP_055383111.1 17-beta-hydroxysteroid dehydrogenase 13-like [Condylostylus longicornis]
MDSDKPVQQCNVRNETKFTYIERTLKFVIKVLYITFVETFISCIQYIFSKRVEPKNIEGQIALVTGGGNGLGKEICIELAKRGCNVAIIDIDLAGATKTAETIKKSYGIQSKAYKADVGNYSEIENLKPKIEKDLGFVDILINNAGLTPVKGLEHYSPEYLRKIVDVNLLSNIWTIRIFLPGMKERKRGHIVQIASIAGLAGVPISNVYSATKFGVRGLMDSVETDIVIENLEDCIHMTTIFPHFIFTNDELCDFLEKSGSLKLMPAFKASYVANVIVTEFLKNKRKVIIPSFMRWLVESQEFITARARNAVKKVVFNGAAQYRQYLNEQQKLTNGLDCNQNSTITSLKKTKQSIANNNNSYNNNSNDSTWMPGAQKVSSVQETIQKFSENVIEEVKESNVKG